MTPRTRTSNKDANYKIYYSKKVPQQARFPHRRKTVRRPETAEQDAGATRQMRFLPEKMRQGKDQDEGQSDEGLDAWDEEVGHSTPVRRGRGGKRKEEDFQDAPDLDAKPTNTSFKRQRRMIMPKDDLSHTIRRQSTMTQLADGRRPSIGAEELDFKPVKRRSRVSWGGTNSKEREWDKKQRTLTQMVPGMGRLSKEELEELSDLDADLEDDGTNKDTVPQPLMEQGLLKSIAPNHMAASVPPSYCIAAQVLTEEEQPQSVAIVQSVEAIPEDHDGEDYQPTQFIDAPTLRPRETPRKASARKALSTLAEPKVSTKSRFGLLSTPEKRRIIEIPSSQSPTESVLSTQVSPEKSGRTALRERTSNTSIIAETPSKRRQVTFKEPSIQPAPPARLRKFESTIQDSEDEEESDLESNASEQEQDLVDHEDHAAGGYVLGAETQAVLDRTDLACAHTAEDAYAGSRESSQENEEFVARQGPYQPSPELGESWAPVIYDDDGPGFGSYRSSRPGAKSQSLQVVHASKDSLPLLDRINIVSQLDLTSQAAVPTNKLRSTLPAMQPQTDDDIPSTPMAIRDESSEEEDAMCNPSPPQLAQHAVSKPSSILLYHSADLDGEPVQVPRSPSAKRETQQSHSSRAEQQLQNEWLSYSQYVHARAPDSSSMHAAVDAFSYNATTRPLKTEAASSSARIQHSQATTVDEVTPKKIRTQRVFSANATPQRSLKFQPFISPEKPPSLFIPSSFPSPSRTAMEGWSSPVAARTQNMYGSSQVMGSLEDFSIPLPPPIEDD